MLSLLRQCILLCMLSRAASITLKTPSIIKYEIANFSRFRYLSHSFNEVKPELLLARIAELNQVTGNFSDTFIPFKVGKEIYGHVQERFLNNLIRYKDVFKLNEVEGGKRILTLQDHLSNLSLDEKTQKIHMVSRALHEEGFVRGWRNEFVGVSVRLSQPPAFLIERALYSHFGLKGYGIHINGFVRDEEGNISHMWVATRSKTKSTFPGMYDHIVAGAQPYGISVSDNVIKECAEEADIPYELAKSAVAVSVVSYAGVDSQGDLKRDVLICLDLELPRSFVPKPVDGEVDKFELHTIDWVLDCVQRGGPNGYKPNCNLVIIDFFIRHGFLSPDTPHFLDILAGLRSADSC